jgi:colicin import membrane protein
MARPGITYDQVASVADAIIGEGQQPTINAVRDRIGTGSPNTIHKHLTAWRAARPQATVAAPELPASLTTAIATEIERAAASARAEIENKLVQAQAEAVELSSVGEALEAERDELFEQVAELTTERDTLAGKAEQQAADIKTQAERIEREQQAAETARVDLAKAQLKVESGTERLVEQASEIERLRVALDSESKARIAAEQQAAVLTARLDSMTDRATKAELRLERVEKQCEQIRQDLDSARNQVQARQSELSAAGRELDAAQIKVREAEAETKQAREEAAELRGKLAVSGQNKPVTKTKKLTTNSAED